MPSKRSVLEVLSAHELRAIVEEFELEPEDRRSRDALIDAVASSHKATLENVLPTLSRKTLKGICRELGLDDGGREKAVIVARILSGDGTAKDAGDEAEPEKASPQRGRSNRGDLMARKKKTTTKRPIESYEHRDKQRVNNPPVGLVTPETDPDAGAKKTYAYDPHLDPQLVGRARPSTPPSRCRRSRCTSTSASTRARIIEAVKRAQRQRRRAAAVAVRHRAREPPLREAIEFYKHAHGWSNRLVAGDSLLVMNSLLEKEGMAGKVQMVYLDPPYGIRYGSNFQPFVNKRDVKDGKDEDLTAEPEQIRAFRDTWELGIHSYLTYLRDRLLLARELLTESGSVFVQISDENVHHVRELMDEVFGAGNFVAHHCFRKKTVAARQRACRAMLRLPRLVCEGQSAGQSTGNCIVERILVADTRYSHG